MSASGASVEAAGSNESRTNRLRQHTVLLVVVTAALIVLALFPSVAQPYYVTLVLPAFAYAIALLGFNLLFGYTGLLSFGHALFVALGVTARRCSPASLVSRARSDLLVFRLAALAIAVPVVCSQCGMCESSSAS